MCCLCGRHPVPAFLLMGDYIYISTFYQHCRVFWGLEMPFLCLHSKSFSKHMGHKLKRVGSTKLYLKGVLLRLAALAASLKQKLICYISIFVLFQSVCVPVQPLKIRTICACCIDRTQLNWALVPQGSSTAAPPGA